MNLDMFEVRSRRVAPVVNLRPYQAAADARIAEQFADCRSTLVVMATGLGKEQPVSEPVLTPSGWRIMGDLCPGDQVIGSAGTPIAVTGVFPQGVKPVWRLELSDGSAVRAGDEHLWTVRTKRMKHRQNGWRTLTTREIREKIGKGWQLPLITPDMRPSLDVDLPVDPYLLGVLLGDGCITNKSVCTDLEIGRALQPALTFQRDHESSPCTGYFGITSPTLRDLRVLGLSECRAWEKFVPPAYMLASASQRLWLLRGLMDTDGYPMGDGGSEFSSTSQALVEAVVELARSLGGVARPPRLASSQYTYKGERRQGRPAWRVNIKLGGGLVPFHLGRKANNYVVPTKYPPARIVRSVVDEQVEEEQVCISVDAPDRLYVTRDHILTHNTVLFSNRARATEGGVLVLAHRKTLLTQAKATLEGMTGERVGFEQGDNYAGQERIVVASKDSLHPDRLARRYRPGDFGLIIVDEAHRAVSGSYTHIFEYFAEAKILGVTATPDRADEKALGAVFESVSYVYEIGDAIGDGWLVPLEVHRKRLDVDLTAVSTTAGDFNSGELDEAMQAENEGVAHETLEVSAGRRSIVFTTSVRNAAVLAETFNKRRGGCARYISGEMDEVMKAGLIADHKAGRFQVLVNVDVLTEGYDDPAVHVIAMARPTKSRIRYAQAIGRGTRPLPGLIEGVDEAEERRRRIAESEKPACVVLDFVGNTGRRVGGKVISLVGPEDILGGKYSDDEIAEAKELTEREPGMQAAEALEKARITLEERARQAQAARLFRANRVKTETSLVDPFSVLGLNGGEDWGGRFDVPATPAQRETLKRLGIDFPDTVSKNAAHKLISAAFKRRDVGLASFKQLKAIGKYVASPPANLRFEDARRILDSIAQNNRRGPTHEALAVIDGYRKGSRRAP